MGYTRKIKITLLLVFEIFMHQINMYNIVIFCFLGKECKKYTYLQYKTS